MVIHLRYSFAFITSVVVSSFCMIAAQDATTCYQGSIESDNKGRIPIGSEQQLSIVPCSPQTSTTSPTAEPTRTTGAASVVPGTSARPLSQQPATTQPASPITASGSASRRRRDVSGYSCSILQSFPPGSKLTLNVTWTANFSCLSTSVEKFPENMFYCNTSNCNSLPFFVQVSKTAEMATVGKCLTGHKNSSGSQIRVQNCHKESHPHFCFNRTLNGQTTFGCSNAETDATCANKTRGETKDLCPEDGDSLCCCSSDNCNGIPPVPPVIPSRIVPTTTPYLVTASRTSSHWLLILFITAGVLIGGLVGVFVMVLCKRWKRKRVSGPLNISYSRVSADCAYEDDDNIFSY